MPALGIYPTSTNSTTAPDDLLTPAWSNFNHNHHHLASKQQQQDLSTNIVDTRLHGGHHTGSTTTAGPCNANLTSHAVTDGFPTAKRFSNINNNNNNGSHYTDVTMNGNGASNGCHDEEEDVNHAPSPALSNGRSQQLPPLRGPDYDEPIRLAPHTPYVSQMCRRNGAPGPHATTNGCDNTTAVTKPHTPASCIQYLSSSSSSSNSLSDVKRESGSRTASLSSLHSKEEAPLSSLHSKEEAPPSSTLATVRPPPPTTSISTPLFSTKSTASPHRRVLKTQSLAPSSYSVGTGIIATYVLARYVRITMLYI